MKLFQEKRWSGFTLIEVLVVILMLGILSSVALLKTDESIFAAIFSANDTIFISL